MDPNAMMNEGSLQMALAMEGLTTWQRSGSFNNSSQFSVEYLGTSRRISNHPMGSEQTVNKRGVNTRKRREKEDELNRLVSTSNGGSTTVENDCEVKRVKGSACNNDNDNRESKCEAEPSSEKHMEQRTKPPLEPPKDYIHVRARRGQATDGHSLAERARREKISERMKILQDLVPGCNRVIGKALVLDEIINYIQSLQRQVEFLSLKLEAVNAMQE